MEFDIRENSSNNEFILCSEDEFEEWKNGDIVYIKDPTNLNNIFKRMCINNIIEPNSFMSRYYLDSIPARAALENIMPDFAEGIDPWANISLSTIWDIYNGIESLKNPYKNKAFLKRIPLKTEKDFSDKLSLYNHVKWWTDHHYKFFSEALSIYSILTMRPKYYDDDYLLLNIFHKKILIGINKYINIYCLSWTSEY